MSVRNALYPLMVAGIEGYKASGWGCFAASCIQHASIRQETTPPRCCLQPDKCLGKGIKSPLDIPIPTAEPGKEDDYYYSDRQGPLLWDLVCDIAVCTALSVVFSL